MALFASFLSAACRLPVRYFVASPSPARTGDRDDWLGVRGEERYPSPERIDQACYGENLRTVKEIFDLAMKNPNLSFKRPPIIAAVEKSGIDNVAVVRFLLSRGQTVFPWTKAGLSGVKVYCPLAMAVRNGTEDVVKLLVENGAKPENAEYSTNSYLVLDQSPHSKELKERIRTLLDKSRSL